MRTTTTTRNVYKNIELAILVSKLVLSTVFFFSYVGIVYIDVTCVCLSILYEFDFFGLSMSHLFDISFTDIVSYRFYFFLFP